MKKLLILFIAIGILSCKTDLESTLMKKHSIGSVYLVVGELYTDGENLRYSSWLSRLPEEFNDYKKIPIGTELRLVNIKHNKFYRHNTGLHDYHSGQMEIVNNNSTKEYYEIKDLLFYGDLGYEREKLILKKIK